MKPENWGKVSQYKAGRVNELKASRYFVAIYTCETEGCKYRVEFRILLPEEKKHHGLVERQVLSPTECPKCSLKKAILECKCAKCRQAEEKQKARGSK